MIQRARSIPAPFYQPGAPFGRRPARSSAVCPLRAVSATPSPSRLHQVIALRIRRLIAVLAIAPATIALSAHSSTASRHRRASACTRVVVSSASVAIYSPISIKACTLTACSSFARPIGIASPSPNPVFSVRGSRSLSLLGAASRRGRSDGKASGSAHFVGGQGIPAHGMLRQRSADTVHVQNTRACAES